MGDDTTMRICGAAGQGLQTIGSLPAGVCHKSGFFVFSHAVKKAVMPADKFQVPANVRMEQYLVDSAMKAPREFDLGDACKPFLQTGPVTKEAQVSQGETFQRYRYTENDISPRIPPCTGAGRYCLITTAIQHIFQEDIWERY